MNYFFADENLDQSLELVLIPYKKSFQRKTFDKTGEELAITGFNSEE